MAHFEKNCITIFLTEKCNLNCKYCYCEEEHKKNNEINIDFCKRGIKDFFELNDYIYLRFFGNGEPTLEFGKMCELTDYAKNLSSNVTIELQTNGYFDRKKRDWILNNIDIIWISYDGLTEVNDFYRITTSGIGSSNIVEDNIKYLSKRMDKVGVRTTIGQMNLYRQIEIIDKMKDLFVKYIYSDLLFEPLGANNLIEDKIDPMYYAIEYIKAYEYAKSNKIFYGSFFTINFDKEVIYSCRSCIPAPHLLPSGFVSACDMACSESGCDDLLYGWYNEMDNTILYNNEKIKRIRSRSVDNILECKDCEVKYHCAGGCLGESLNEKGNIFRIKEQNCEAIRYLGKKLNLEDYVIPIMHP